MRTLAYRCGGLLAAALLVGCASPTRHSKEVDGAVEAEGWAPIDASDAPGTRNRALADAQRRAVEMVAGVSLAASTRVEAAVSIRQKIVADVRGRIRRYDVLSEEAAAGFYKMRIRAVVLRYSEREDRVPPPESARVSLRITGDALGVIGAREAAADAIVESLRQRGFQLVEEGSGSNVALRGSMRTYPIQDWRLGGLNSCRVRISMEAIDARTGLVIWRQSEEGASFGVDSQNAAITASENAGTIIGKEAAESAIAYLWKNF